MRLFFSAPIPGEQRALLVKMQEELKGAKADVKWVLPEQLHITFRFLGEVHPKQLPTLKRIGEEVSRLYGLFNASVKNIGFFPLKVGPPQVVWAGIEDGKAALSMMAQALEVRAAQLKLKHEEKNDFNAHVTLGRIRNPKTIQPLVEKAAALEFTSDPWLFDHFTLEESRQDKAGSIYKTVFTFKLGQREPLTMIQQIKRLQRR